MTHFNICSVLPFWLYAVCSSNPTIPGVPFYTLKDAKAFFKEVSKMKISTAYLRQVLRRIGCVRSDDWLDANNNNQIK